MNLRALCALAALMASCVVSSLPAAAADRPLKRTTTLNDSLGDARVIVQFKDAADITRAHALAAGADKAAAAATLQRRADMLASRRGLQLLAGRGISPSAQVVHASGMTSATLARLLAADPDVEYAEVDHRRRHAALPNDPLFAPVAGTSPASGQWYLKAPDATTPASTNTVAAWDTTTGKPNMVVAVLDTGVRFDHPDLADKLLTGRDMVSNATVANDGTARDSDAADPGDWITSADQANSLFTDCDVSDSSWHGTIVSGIIGAASNNGVGMAGVSGNTKILPVRVLGKCFGYDSDIQAGMRWAAGLSVPGEPVNPSPARVLNLSLGGDGTCSQTYKDAVNQVTAAGAVIVAAAGNSEGHAVETPGNCPGVIAVAGLRHAGTKVGYSDLGPEVALAAPAGNCVSLSGECVYPILSTTNTGTTTPVAGSAGASYTDGFNYSVGTSFSSPLVAGAAALMLSANPSLTPAQVKSLLQSSARAFPTTGGTAGTPVCQAPSSSVQDECYCTAGTCGAGMLDTGAAVQAAAQAAPSPNGAQADIAISPAVPATGETVTLTATVTVGSVSTYAWSVVAGNASIAGPTDASSTTLVAGAAGDVRVRLTLTDVLGAVTTIDQPFRVTSAANAPAPSGNSGSSSGGGGGGAFSWPWLLALALAVALLACGRRHAQI